MPRPYNITTIKPLKGLRTTVDRSALGADEFSTLYNFNPPKGGYIEKRRGLYRVNITPTSPRPQGAGVELRLVAVTINANSPNSDLFWVTDGTVTWHKRANLDSAGYTLINSPPTMAGGIEWGFQRISGTTPNVMFFCRRTDPTVSVVSDGTGAWFNNGGPDGTHTLEYKGRQWVINSLGANGAESTVTFSGVNNFSVWPTDPLAGSIAVRATDGQWFVTMQVYNDDLYLFKNKSIWKLNADSADQTTYTPRLVHDSIGCIGRGTVKLINGFMYFLAHDGVYRTDGTTFEEISEPVRSLFQVADQNSQSECLQIDAVYYDGKYILSVYNSTYLYVFDITSEAWSIWQTATGLNIKPAGMAIYGRGTVPRLFMGTTSETGYLMAMGDAFYRDGTTGPSGGTSANDYNAAFGTGYNDGGAPGEFKRNHYVALDCEGGPTTQVELVHHKDVSSATPTTKALIDTERTFLRFPGAGKNRFTGVYGTVQPVPGNAPGEFNLYSIAYADALENKVGRAG